MRKMKQWVVSMMLLCMIVIMGTSASAASGIGDDGLKWTLENGTLIISGKGAMDDHSVAGAGWGSWIGKNVENATHFKYMSADIKTVVVSKNVTRIGNGAFAFCINLTTAKIADSVKRIKSLAFVQDEKLAVVYIPSSVTKIDSKAFYQCTGLKDVYYAGSKNQWKKITIEAGNECLTNATIHYNAEGIDTPAALSSQTIKVASKLSKTVGNAAFSLGASAKTSLSYASDNTSVAAVSKKGKVTIKGAGTAKITITAAKSAKYKAATKTVTITVKPKMPAIQTVKCNSAGKATIKWKKVTKIGGYEIQYSTSSKFTNVQTIKIAAAKTKTTLSNLASGKKYYVRMRTYKVDNGKTYYSQWSTKKTINKK